MGPNEAARLKDLRLKALADSPSAFGMQFSHAATWSWATWCEKLEARATFVAVASSGPGAARDVGLVRCVLHPEAHTASLVSLWVEPEARRAGAAGQLIGAVLGYAREHGMGRVVLDVVETNIGAIALYRRYGFVPNGERGVFPESCQGMAEVQFELLL